LGLAIRPQVRFSAATQVERTSTPMPPWRSAPFCTRSARPPSRTATNPSRASLTDMPL